MDEYDRYGDTPLINLIKEGNLHGIRLLEKQYNINQADITGVQPLFWAINKKEVEIADFLIKEGARVNIIDHNESSPLHLCLLHHDLHPLVPSLLHYGCDPNTRNKLGNTPLILALESSNIDLLNSLLCCQAEPDAFQDIYPLHYACTRGDVKAVILLLLWKAECNRLDRSGKSPLHHAFEKVRNRLVLNDIFECMREAGADIYIRDSLGKKPLDYIHKFPKITQTLGNFNPSSRSWKFQIGHDEDLKIDFNQELGRGGHGIVYCGTLHGTPVAVKVPKEATASFEKLHHEIGLMAEIRHPNVLCFLGTAMTSCGLCIITEYIDGGPLSKYIQSSESRLPFHKIKQFSMDTARALAWLHARCPPVFHRDLHTNNILVLSQGGCKVADFGISQISGAAQEQSRLYQRIRPPEILQGEEYSKASDVYMYGLVLYELLTGRKAQPMNPDSFSASDQFFHVLVEKNARKSGKGFIKKKEIKETHPSQFKYIGNLHQQQPTEFIRPVIDEYIETKTDPFDLADDSPFFGQSDEFVYKKHETDSGLVTPHNSPLIAVRTNSQELAKSKPRNNFFFLASSSGSRSSISSSSGGIEASPLALAFRKNNGKNNVVRRLNMSNEIIHGFCGTQNAYDDGEGSGGKKVANLSDVEFEDVESFQFEDSDNSGSSSFEEETNEPSIDPQNFSFCGQVFSSVLYDLHFVKFIHTIKNCVGDKPSRRWHFEQIIERLDAIVYNELDD